MEKRSGITALRSGFVRLLREIKAEYCPIEQPVRLSVSQDSRHNIALVGKHVILNGSKLVNEGALLQLKFDLKGVSKHRFGSCKMSGPQSAFIGIGQVSCILDSYADNYKMLVRLLDLKQVS